MYELTINDVVYQFNFGMGFMREVNKKVCTPVDGLKAVSYTHLTLPTNREV